jgi:hypothetical protein
MSNETKLSADQVNDLINRMKQLEQQVTELTNNKKSQKSQKEMTDEHAVSVCYGEFKNVKHNEIAQKLGLSYGQIYSCRLEYTFRHIHEKYRKNNIENIWKKK